MESFTILKEEIIQSVQKNNFVKITLSKPISKSNPLQNVYVRQFMIKEQVLYQFTYRFKTNDQVKNFNLDETIDELSELLLERFRFCTLFTLEKDFLTFVSKKKQLSFKSNAPSFKNKLPGEHNKQKVKRIEKKAEFLRFLRITDNNDSIIPKMADKYRQINKYLEIIEGVLGDIDSSKELHIVDMGSGKGYLTFALYDFLVNIKKLKVSITGIELRENLVKYCNDVAIKCNYENLNFIAQRIENYKPEKIDVLIALHACDTATDDAIFKGISSKANLIICAPCCHKQLRQQVKGLSQESSILKYGIFKERQFEMLTDTIRALILESYNYNTNIFEFVSNEHTRKNIMLVASQSKKIKDVSTINNKIQNLKNDFKVSEHYLESLLN